MPLHGKVVVIKRSGGDGTEFPLTAACLFGRKPDCDIRIQLPEVSKEHCRIDLNENKEVILTNLSSVNPTRINGEVLQQSERLKHGDVITIIDRSFRFEYPPAPTPKKRSSTGGKAKTFKVLQDQQLGDTVSTETGEKRISEVSTDPHLKDGTNHDNIQRSLEKTVEEESKGDDSLLQNKTTSPFNDLYQMIKKSLDVKTPRKSSASLLVTPTSRFCTPKPVSVRKTGGNPVISSEDETSCKRDEAKVSSGPEKAEEKVGKKSNGTPKSVKKQRESFQVSSTEMEITEAENAVKSEATSPLKRNHSTPQRFSVSEVIEQVSAQMPKSPMRRRSKEATPAKSAVTSLKAEHVQKTSPRNSGKFKKEETSQKRKSGVVAADLTQPQMKKKRVSFGGHLSPELFDKRLPPDSPLRRGAAPRRSLCLTKPKQSLLRRASVIGLLQEFEQELPDSSKVQSPAKKKTPSPKKKSSVNTASPKGSTPGKKSPKSRSPSPKASTPAKKSPKSSTSSPKAASLARQSPKSRSPSPKASTPAKKSPKSSTSSPKAASPARQSPKPRSQSPKASTPGKKSPKSSTPSPKATSPSNSSSRSRSLSPKASPAGKKSKSVSPSPVRKSASKKAKETPEVQTPRVEGRFSVSLIRTPSPVAEDANTDQVPSVTATPKLPLRRKSMKSSARKTPSVSKSAAKVICRRSGISRASMKVSNSWAEIVKFGKIKTQVAAPARKTATQKTKKKAVSKPQTPARKLKDHESTGHADSPVTFVVGRAHKQKVVHPTGAAPRLVTNTALLKKNMKMDEDLTGISEMFKTPVSERTLGSVVNENSAMKTPVEGLGTSVVDPSVLNTPEESGEMMVSPLSVSSAMKNGQYNSEAVQRLFIVDQESSFITDNSAMEIQSDSVEQQSTDLKTSVATPKQKPELPECLTGVKRIMKTPRQKAEPVEDLRGNILKTPKQKPQQQECLTGVKRIMKTPRQKAEPVEDLRANILKTPKQKPEQQECLTAVKRIFKTPQQETEPLEEKHLDMPKVLKAGHVSLDDVKETEEQTAHMQDSEDPPEMTDMKTPNVKSSPSACLTGVKRIMKTPKEKCAPVEDMVGVKRLMKTPREKMEPVEVNFGIKRLVKSPRLQGNSPVEDFEGLQELMREPVIDSKEQLETNEVEDQTPQDCGMEVAKELDFAHEEPRENVLSDVTDDVAQAHMEKEADANAGVVDRHLEEVASRHNNDESSDATATISKSAVVEYLPVEEPKVDKEDENVPKEEAEMESASDKVSEADMDPDHDKKPVRGRRAKVVESKSAEDKQEAAEKTEEPVIAAPTRGRRGKKTEAVAPPAARQTGRGRNAKSQENTSEDQPEMVPEKAEETPVTEASAEVVSDQPSPINTHQEENDAAPPAVEAVVKATRGRKTKKTPVEQPQPEQEKNVDMGNQLLEAETQLQKATSKPRRGRKTKADTEEQNDVSEDTVVAEENKQQSQPPVRAKRGRNAKQEEEKLEMTESKDTELVTEKTDSLSSKGIPKSTRGTHAKKSSNDQADKEVSTETEMVPEPKSEESPLPDVEANNSAAHLEKVVSKAKRGRKTKPAQSVPEQQDVPCAHSDNVLQVYMKKADANEVCSGQLEVLPNECDENKTAEAVKTIPQAPTTENLPEMDTANSIAPETDPPVIQKKTVRGRRAKVVESKSAEDKQEAAEKTEEPVIAAPTRGRRGKKTEAVAPPAARQTGRGRNAKSQENTSEEQADMVPEKAEETTPVTEASAEVVSDQPSPINTHQEENDAAPPAEEAVVKPTRGRKTKKTPVEQPQPEQEKNVDMGDQLLEAETQLQKATSKPRRGRKTKADTEEQNEVSEDTVVAVENKQQSQPPVRAKRGRNVKQEEEKLEMTESKDTELVTEKTDSLSSKGIPKSTRGRHAKKSSNDQADKEVSTETEMVPEPKSEESPLPDVEANNSAAHLEKVVSKAKRGRKTKPAQSVPEQQDVPCAHSDNVLQVYMKKADANEVCSGQLEVLPNECDENKTAEAVKTIPQAPTTENLPEMDTANSIAPETDPPVIQKKTVRGRRAKVVESKSAEDKQEAAEKTEEPVIAAPTRGRRGKKTEAVAPPAARQTGRGRNAKSQENTSEDQAEMVPEKAEETTPVTEASAEVVSDQPSPINTHQEENGAAPPAEEAIVKATRGRKTKKTPVEQPQPEQEKNVDMGNQLLEAETQLQKATSKPRRGRKTKADTEEQNDVSEDTVVAEENKQQSQPPVRAKRGRNAKQEEEKLENNNKTPSVETTKEPVKKIKRTRKAVQDHEEPREDIQTVETVYSEDAKASLAAEQVKINGQASVAAKPRRGQKAKQDTERENPVESAGVQEVSVTDKQRRGRRGKQVPEEVEVTVNVPEEKPDHELKGEEDSKVEPDTPVIKRTKARGVKNEVSQATPAKRARRGAALPNEGTSVESTVLVLESESTSTEPVKRGRRAAVKPKANDAAVSSDQTNPSEDLNSAVMEDAKMSKKSVKWKTNLEVFEIEKVTPAKAVRGRKSKIGADADSKNVSEDASKTEEANLSDEVVKAQSVKRARRDANVADVTADKDKSETQPKTRRGRSAKK